MWDFDDSFDPGATGYDFQLSASDPGMGNGPGGSAAPAGPNRWLEMLKRNGTQYDGAVSQDDNTGKFSSTYADPWNPRVWPLARGARTHGPINALVGEAGPEQITYSDGRREMVTSPQLRRLGVNGRDTVTPLTPPPHRMTPEGKRMVKRLKRSGVQMLADGGVFDDDRDIYPLDVENEIAQDNAAASAPPVAPRQFQPPQPQPLPAAPQLAPPEQAPTLSPPPDFQPAPMPSASSVAPQPPTHLEQLRQQLGALRQPSPPGLWRQLAGSLLAASPVGIATGPLQQRLLYPGLPQYERQRADIVNQIQQEQGNVADQQAQANLAQTQANTGLAQSRGQRARAEIANMPAETILTHPDLIPDPDPLRQNPDKYPGEHVTLDGQHYYRLTPQEQMEMKQNIAKKFWPVLVQGDIDKLKAAGISGYQVGEQVDPRTMSTLQATIRKTIPNATNPKMVTLNAEQSVAARSLGLDAEHPEQWTQQQNAAWLNRMKPPPTSVQITMPGLNTPPPANLSGDQFLSTLPPGTANQVRAIAEGRATLPSASARTPAAQQLRAAVFQYDPTFSEQRAQVRKAFTTGPDGKNIGALNTASVHLGQLEDAVQALQSGSFTPGNAVYNYFRKMLGAEPPTNFAQLKAAVSGEMASALKGVATDQEIKTMSENINSSMSPQQLQGAVSTNLHILGAKLKTYQQRYQQQIPGDTTWNPVLPQAQTIYKRHGFDPMAEATQGTAPIVQQSPSTGQFRYSVDGGKTWQAGKPPNQ